MTKKLNLLTIIALLWQCPVNTQAVLALIIDTEGKQAYYYDTLHQLATTCNFNCSYKNIYDMLEYPEIDAKNHALFFFISPQIIVHQQHPITQEIMQAVHSFAHDGNKLITLLLPSHIPADQLTTLLQSFNLSPSLHPKIIAQQYVRTIAHPSAQQAQQYGTSLINKTTIAQAPLTSGNKVTIPKNMMLLPHIKEEQPLSMTIYDPSHNNIMVLAPSIDMTFADVAENFHKNPHLFTDRNQLLEHVQELLWQLHNLSVRHMLPTTNKPALPACFTPQLAPRGRSFSAAWLEPKDFYLHEEPQTDVVTKDSIARSGCAFLQDCGFDLLWFEINPEWYFSERALFKKDTNAVMNIMKKLGNLILTSSDTSPARNPKIFIGSDITSNFNGQRPSTCVYDLFGNAYPNIPSPFAHTELWHQELIEPFKKCYEHLVSHLPINGLFLDFEMYHAPQQASSYHDLMDFSASAWQVFKKYHPQTPTCTSVNDRIHYLKTHKCFGQYFDTLTQEARNIGQYIRQQLQSLNPQLRIATYAPTLPSSWFYRGIMSGLSTPETPLITATFNTDFYRHKSWLEHNNIFLTHGSAMMMSKLTDTHNTLIKQIAPHHDFIWYNRPSRQLYQTKSATLHNKWWQAEYSGMKNKKLARHIKRHHAKRTI